MIKAKHLILTVLFLGLPLELMAEVSAAPGDYSFRAKIGPSFELSDYENQFLMGGEFDYELGYSLGLNLLLLGGVGEDSYRFQMIPALRYDYLYIGPASFYGLAGMGYGRIESENTLDFRVGTGVSLPLGDSYEFNSDASLFLSPVGTVGTPVTFSWLIGFGFKFN